MKVKVESEKVGLKLNIQKMKIMTSGPITSWEIDGETVETVSDSIFWGSKITADGDQPRQHIKKQRHYFANKVCVVKIMVFPVVMYGCESWSIKKAERQRIDAFKLWCGGDS